MLMFLVAGAFAGVSFPAPARADSLRFPVVEGTNLEKRRFILPADFEGEWNVVLVAFRREQQADVDTWMPHLKALERAYPPMHTYELPTLTRSYRWMRRFIDGGMAGGIPDRSVREHTITLYIDKAPFKRELGIPDEESIRVYLVARDGRVAWSGAGPWNAGADAALRAAAASAGGAGGAGGAATPAVSAAGTGS